MEENRSNDVFDNSILEFRYFNGVDFQDEKLYFLKKDIVFNENDMCFFEPLSLFLFKSGYFCKLNDINNFFNYPLNNSFQKKTVPTELILLRKRIDPKKGIEN